MKHTLILGCGRSGTSIFGELFETFPTYQYFSEPPFEALLNYDYSSPIAIKVPKESQNYKPTKGLSFPLSVLLSTIPPHLQLFWIVRHPLDTICSLRVGISKNWGHHPQPPDWKDWLHRPLLEQCAHHWNYLNTVGFEQVKDLVEIVHFEDMIQNSLGFAKRIGNLVELDINQYQKELEQWANRVQNTNNHEFVEAKTSRSYSRNDHKVKVGRWKENLKPADIELIRPIIEATANRFGYSIPFTTKKVLHHKSK